MKKCPYCGEKLDDNARFCLYCMKSLEEKEKIISTPDNSKRRIILVVSAVLVLVVLIIVLLLCLHSCGDDSKNKSGGSSEDTMNIHTNGDSSYSGSPASSDMTNMGLPDGTLLSPENTDSAESSSTPGITDSEEGTLLPMATSAPTSGNILPTNGGNTDGNSSLQQNTNMPNNTSRPITSANSDNTTKAPSNPQKTTVTAKTTAPSSTVRPTASNQAVSTAVSTAKPQNTTVTTTTSSPQKTSVSTSASVKTNAPSSTVSATSTPVSTPEVIEDVTWYYYDAAQDDIDKINNRTDSNVQIGNAIFICGFKNITSNGIYKIPETIDGKTVVGINMSYMAKGYTFGSREVRLTAKKVYLPPQLTVLYESFSNCTNITDIYVSAEKLYVSSNNLPEHKDFTLHASETCIAYIWIDKHTFKKAFSLGLYEGKFEAWDKSEQY